MAEARMDKDIKLKDMKAEDGKDKGREAED